LRKKLLKFLLGLYLNLAFMIKDDGTGTGGTLIDCH